MSNRHVCSLCFFSTSSCHEVYTHHYKEHGKQFTFEPEKRESKCLPTEVDDPEKKLSHYSKRVLFDDDRRFLLDRNLVSPVTRPTGTDRISCSSSCSIDNLKISVSDETHIDVFFKNVSLVLPYFPSWVVPRLLTVSSHFFGQRKRNTILCGKVLQYTGNERI